MAKHSDRRRAVQRSEGSIVKRFIAGRLRENTVRRTCICRSDVASGRYSGSNREIQRSGF